MSQFQAPPFGPDVQAQPSEPAKTSGLALASLICSLIICCPCLTVFGPILGLIAVATIASNPARKGKGIAVAGVLIGLIATALWVVGLFWAYKTYQVPLTEGPRAQMTAAFDGDAGTFRAGMMGDAAQASDAEVAAFVAELQTRYGAFRTCRLDEANIMPPADFEEAMAPIKSYPYVFEFENKTVEATIDYATYDPSTQEQYWGVRWDNIIIHDDVLGDISLPAGAAGAGLIDTDVDPPSDDGEGDAGEGDADSGGS